MYQNQCSQNNLRTIFQRWKIVIITMFRRHVFYYSWIYFGQKYWPANYALSHIIFTELTTTVLVQQNIFEKPLYSNYGKAH
jgi:hypothetical protein